MQVKAEKESPDSIEELQKATEEAAKKDHSTNWVRDYGLSVHVRALKARL